MSSSVTTHAPLHPNESASQPAVLAATAGDAADSKTASPKAAGPKAAGPTTAGPKAAAPKGGRGLGVTLAVVLVAQLMIILDMTVVNIALPRIADGLHLQAAGLSWVMNAYALTFGGLLLLGGRAGDLLGRRRVFMAGIALFTLASLAGGLATSAPMLLAARAVQGVGAAFATPATLATIVTSFPEGRPRTRALALFTGVITGGASLGLVLGGMITQWATWRWVFFVNVPVGVAVILVAPRVLARSARRSGRFDAMGALTSTTGMAALVYGFIRAASAGWTDRLTLAAFAAAIALLTAFVVTEARTAQPVTPLRLFADRNRVGSYLARLLLVGGMFGMFFFLTQFVQNVLGFSPLQAGVSFLPMTAALFAVSRLAPRLIPRLGAKRLMLAGMLPVIGGMAWLAQITPATTYWPGVLGPMLLVGTGMGLAFVPLTMASLAGVAPEDSGAASSMVNVTQQAGGALGLAILITVYGNASRAAAAHTNALSSQFAQVQHILAHAMATSFAAAAVFDVLALLVISTAVRFSRAAVPTAR
ncbi:MAG TPA: MFS transporter [Streptosporangiaceae bacterium]|nr:MFS transporter [Streptosporangiaceae bacterium]